jgi:hypothetical protein
MPLSIWLNTPSSCDIMIYLIYWLNLLLHYCDYTLRLSYCLSSCCGIAVWYYCWSSLCSYGCITAFPRWYIFEETILCIWTAALYIESLRLDVDKAWYDMLFSSKFYVAAHLLWILCFQFGLWFSCYAGLGSFSSYYRWKDFVGVILLAVLIFILIFLLLLWLFHS